jgi:hypothetical protein
MDLTHREIRQGRAEVSSTRGWLPVGVDPSSYATSWDPNRHIAAVLARHGVEYILIGGMGGQIQGVPVGVTRDADFTARQTGQNLERVG